MSITQVSRRESVMSQTLMKDEPVIVIQNLLTEEEEDGKEEEVGKNVEIEMEEKNGKEEDIKEGEGNAVIINFPGDLLTCFKNS